MESNENPSVGLLQSHSAPRPVLIAIPFYKNEHLVTDVIGSLLRNAADVTAIGGEVVLYNDSPEHAPLATALANILPAAQACFPCRIERNPVNLGFVKTMNRAIDEAVARKLDLLLLNSDTMVEPGALPEMVRVSRLDAMIGFVNPRSNNATITTLPLAERFAGAAPAREAYRALAARLPDYSYAPTAVGFCMLIRWSILAEFGGFDEIYGAGYNEENDLVMRAGRCGYRAVLANKAFVWHEGEQSFGTADLKRPHWEAINRALLDQRYPEYGAFTAAHYEAPETIAEKLLASLIPNAAGRRDMAFDCSSFVPAHNGTFQAGKQLLAEAVKVWGDDFDLYVLCSPKTYEFCGFRNFGLRLRDPHGPEKYAVIFRIGQPYDWNVLQRLTTKAAVIGLYMLDTISIDCPQLTSPGLFNLWQFALKHVDMVAALSRMTLDQLRGRFDIPARVVVSTVLLSLDRDDYRLPGAECPAPGAGTLLALGNHYAHKHLAPTANALAEAFPDRKIIALGLEKPVEAAPFDQFAPHHLGQAENLIGVAVGGLDDAEIGAFYAQADAIVFPTHYEGFGIPVLNALAARRPVFVRPLPVFDELWRGQNLDPNIHFYETTADLIERLRDVPAWRDSDLPPAGNGADRMAREIRAGLDAALARIDYHHIVERLRAIRSVSDVGIRHDRAPQPSGLYPRGLRSLLALEGSDFVHYAYLEILGREPDLGGLSNYLGLLDGSPEAKSRILRGLRDSPEGRRRGSYLPALDAWLLYKQFGVVHFTRRALRRLARAPRPVSRDAR
jgi:GT2 family glycosyltransferase